MAAESPTILATSMGFNRARVRWEPGPVFTYAFQLAGKPKHPRLCFITTANGDQAHSIESFYRAFDGSDVETSHLALFDKPNVEDIRAHLLEQDVIWVDRGSVVNLLAVWRAHKVDDILRECWHAGVVLGGESAGSLCWHRGGTTDSFGKVKEIADGLGFLPYSNTVHYKERAELYRRLVADEILSAGYATDAGAGLHYQHTEMIQAIADRANSHAYWVERTPDGSLKEERIEPLLLRR